MLFGCVNGSCDMQRCFEDYFSEYQADMISVCLEYAEKRIDVVYVYCSYENKRISCDFFYEIAGQLVAKHQLNTLPQAKERPWDVSLTRQIAALRTLSDDVQKLIALCDSRQCEVPSEIKIIYNVDKNNLVANYKYGPVYSMHSGKGPDNIVEEWFAELSAQQF